MMAAPDNLDDQEFSKSCKREMKEVHELRHFMEESSRELDEITVERSPVTKRKAKVLRG